MKRLPCVEVLLVFTTIIVHNTLSSNLLNLLPGIRQIDGQGTCGSLQDANNAVPGLGTGAMGHAAMAP